MFESEADLPLFETENCSKKLKEEPDNNEYRNISLVGSVKENRLVTSIGLGGRLHSAMFDSGAQCSLIPVEILVEAGIAYQPLDDEFILGFGSSGPTKVLGKVSIAIEMHGLNLKPCEFLVLESIKLSGMIMLGVHFLKKNEFILDLKHRRVRKRLDDGTIWDCYIDENSKNCRIVWSNLPLSVASATTIQPKCIENVNASWSYPDIVKRPCCACCSCNQELLFLDEKESNQHLQLISGIFPAANNMIEALVVNLSLIHI